MAYWIIGFVVLLALAPLWHFMPSKRQRHEAELRETAALSGLFVEFRDLPLPADRLQRLPASERQLLYYGCRLPPSRGDARKRSAWWREGDEWRSQDYRSAVPGISAELPATVLALAVSEASCGLFWREQGDAATVRDLAAILARWRDELSADRGRSGAGRDEVIP